MRKKRKIKKKIKLILILIPITILIILILLKGGLFNIEPKQVKNDIKINKYINYQKTTNYKIQNLERYIKYKEIKPNLSYEDIVTYVNIGLDQYFYSNIVIANTSYSNLILINKYIKLENNYEPNDLKTINEKYFIHGNESVRKLKKEAQEQFEKLSEESIKNKTPVYGQSAYRTYQKQNELYNQALENGEKNANSDTAKPGHSEHQTGLAIDVSSTKDGNMLRFENTKSFNWMQNNAYKYGFILRYPKDKINITGYKYESWHYRYVGIKTATKMHNDYPNLTYDEYYYKFIENKKD